MPCTHRQRRSFLRSFIAEQELAGAEDVKRASGAEDNFDDRGSVLSAADLLDSQMTLLPRCSAAKTIMKR